MSAIGPGKVVGVSLLGRFVLPKFLSLPINPVEVLRVGGSVFEVPNPAEGSSTNPAGPPCIGQLRSSFSLVEETTSEEGTGPSIFPGRICEWYPGD